MLLNQELISGIFYFVNSVLLVILRKGFFFHFKRYGSSNICELVNKFLRTHVLTTYKKPGFHTNSHFIVLFNTLRKRNTMIPKVKRSDDESKNLNPYFQSGVNSTHYDFHALEYETM